MKARLLIVLLLSCSVATAFAQEVQENIKVIFRDVRVHVTDGDGNPVRGLKLEDFSLTEAGNGQRIDFFEEVDLSQEVSKGTIYHKDGLVEDPDDRPVRASGKERSLVLFIDSSNMTKDAFEPFVETVHEFIDSSVVPGDLVKVVQFDERLEILSAFTSNKNDLHAAVDKAKYAGNMRNRLEAAERLVTDKFTDYLQPQVTNPFPGELEQIRDGLLLELEDAVRQKHSIKTGYYKAFESSLGYLARIFDQMSGSKSVYLFTGGQHVIDKSLVGTSKEVARLMNQSLNSSNVTVYTMIHLPQRPIGHSHRFTGRVRLDDETNPLRSLGLNSRPSEGTILEDTVELSTGPYKVTDGTGGIIQAAHKPQDIGSALKKFQTRANHYYRLGYSVDSPDKQTQIKIKLSDAYKNAKLSYGGTFNPVKTYLELKPQDRAIAFEASLQYTQSFRDDLDAQPGFRGFKHPVEKGDMIPVYLGLKVNQFPKNGYEIGFAALNAERGLIDLVRSTVKKDKHQTDFLLYDVLLPKAKPALLRFKIVNLDNGEESLLEVPYEREEKGETDFHISEMVFFGKSDREMVPLNHLRYNGTPEKDRPVMVDMRKHYDPLAMANYLFKPVATDNLFPAKEHHLFFQIRNMEKSIENYQIKYTLKRGGEQLPVEFQVKDAYQPKGFGNTYHFVGTFSGIDFDPGDYELMIEVVDDQADAGAQLQRTFSVAAK
ncbi:VWA domain-containing protein [Acanthopleuribacter pedis]|uniref:VWA domain-containing protein n=1 Tax=Acanthopleuribacter pedis TaxID=442870 RepID=A0A8J7QD47_9BACT|nr:VWA domain-containing protein [Acanthopleuribacter pedis]MBO1321589.1 VWA domain-containing protein [Acanthopleuribacter pedis]